MQILGVSAFYHDSAAALITDGIVNAAAQEERFSRKKGDQSFPTSAIRWILDHSQTNIDNLDAIVFYEKPWITFERIIETYISQAPSGLASFLMAMPKWLNHRLKSRAQIKHFLIHDLGANRKKIPPILFCPHHLSHAASAYYASGFNDSAVLCLDGVGEWATTSAWIGNNSSLKPLWEIHFPHSLGLFYSAMTSYCGFKVNSGEYKLMGLAPYGQPSYEKILEKELIQIFDNGAFRLNTKYFGFLDGFKMLNQKFEKLIGFPPRQVHESLNTTYLDLAASAQAIVEKSILRLALTLQKETQSPNLCLAGGVALNCVANGKLAEKQIFKKIFVQPAAGDSGGALGAALAAFHLHFNRPRPKLSSDLMQGSYLGPEFTHEQIEQSLIKYKLNYVKMNEHDLLRKTASSLAQNDVVGWFQNRMEFGPRALGNRSILADPRDPKMKNNLNQKIKFREGFRPFAPAVRLEQQNSVFEMPTESPYMLLTGKTIQPESFPAVTHVDGSARVQTVTSSGNTLFYNLLTEFEAQTGCPTLINTSFNVRGEPIVCRPDEAIECFIQTDMDALVIGSFFVDKRSNLKIARDHKWKDQFAAD